VRYIDFDQIVDAVEFLCGKAAYELPQDVLAALAAAEKKESHLPAAKILHQLIENAHIAATERIPLCQDTGLAVVFVDQGVELALRQQPGKENKTITEAINVGVTAGYENGYLRKSVVADPLHTRANTNSNTPVVVHHSTVPGDKLKITLMAKGGGCENKSRFQMFNPTTRKDEIADWIVDVTKQAGADACPPFIVGVGIGGNFELSCLLSKRALLRRLDQTNSSYFYAKLEDYLLRRINTLGLGPQGLGGDTTALAVLIETAPCHIASLPVAVNIECHSHRHHSLIL